MTGIQRIPLLLVLCCVSLAAHPQDFSGQYALRDTAEAADLVFERNDDGTYTGTLGNEGFEVVLNGEIADGMLLGMVDDGSESIAFIAELENQNLVLSLVELDALGQAIVESAQSLLFDRAGTASARAPAARPAAATDEGVVVNGRSLSAAELTELEALYGVAPLPGAYWYDAASGLYGAVGYQAFGFMFPGHEFGPLQRDASAGDTSVFVNGRELPQGEWLIWSYMLGAAIEVGSYWLDAQGNAGYEGNPIPLVNLYLAAQQNSYSGQGGSGENFWSSRFSAGNYDSGNTRGYVSVPGHGPVGYGF